MFIIKAYEGDGAWALWEADRVSLLGPNQTVEVELDDDGRPQIAGDQIPSTGANDERYVLTPGAVNRLDGSDESPRQVRYMRWIEWDLAGAHTLLVTDGPVFVCNDRGDTVEALR